MTTATAAPALARLESWLETMRGPGGYGGPVAHWWRDSVVCCGPGLDWRYEGIITGYLSLFQTTGDAGWLHKARRVGDDLVAGQLPSGNYRNSEFELNPGTGGTPHEAACDSALLRLASALRQQGAADWEPYYQAAARNLREYYLGQLWRETEQSFRDDPGQPSFVPNKAATLAEALFLLADVSGNAEFLERYVRPTLATILAHQVRALGNPCDGAIAQNSFGRTVVAKYFPYYTARCIPPLVLAYRTFGDETYLNAARRGLAFVLRWQDADGGFPQVVYPGGRVNRYPRWIAGVGDVLLALDSLRSYGLDAPAEPTLTWMLRGQQASGAFRTAEGFGSLVSQRQPQGIPDWRDLLPVVGWCDKAFRYLAGVVAGPLPPPTAAAPVAMVCTFQGKPAWYQEDARAITVQVAGRTVYRWRKGANWADLSS